MRNKLQKMPKWLKIAIPVLFVCLVIAFIVIGWYFSSKLTAVKLQQVEYDQIVTSIKSNEYTIMGSAYDVDGMMGGIREDGSLAGIFSKPLSEDKKSKTSVRTLPDSPSPALSEGQKISLQGNIWTTDPKQALGIDYQTIKYPGPLGDMDAWIIPVQNPKKWVIAVHGIGAPKREMLRFVKPVLEAGNNMMIIEYRNDANSPRSPDKANHLGDTEWEDLEAAVRYVEGQGAEEINLFGVSMGGSVVQNYLRRSSDDTQTNINKVILDSPALNWEEVLQYQAKRAGYPSFIYFPATVVANVRYGINMDRITTKPEHITHETLLIHNEDDPTVPYSASKKLAEARPDLVTFVSNDSGGHVRAWNHDPESYEATFTGFLVQE